MTIGIISAMDSEHRRLVERLQDKNTSGDGSFRYVEGTLLSLIHILSVRSNCFLSFSQQPLAEVSHRIPYGQEAYSDDR